jgi:tetratricopeptide (TPR) repeat protein
MSWGLPAMLAGNLLLPASNVVTIFNEPIFYLYTSMFEYAHPPAQVNADYYVQQAQIAMAQKNTVDAMKLLNWAVQLNPKLASAYESRAILKSNNNSVADAVIDADKALELTPDGADALFTRGYVHLHQGHPDDARTMLQQALKIGGDQWPQKQQCENLLAQLHPAAAPGATPADAPWHLSL